jgi:hypothetical protein
MHSPTQALTWQVCGRHRRGLAVVVFFLLGTAVVFNVLPAGTLEPQHGAMLSIEFVLGLIYVAAAFAYGFESQLEGRASCFPARLFTLPVRTLALVGWPMLQGMGAVALLWVAWAYFVLRPSGIEVALGSTALLAAAFVGVLQALLWSPFGLPWVRVLLAVVLLPVLAVAPQLGPALGVHEGILIGLYAALVPLSAAMAFAGVARARHGEAPDWRIAFRSRPAAARRTPARGPFATAARAQLWYEARRHLFPFPLAVAVLAALEFAFLYRLAGPLQEANYKAVLGLNFLLLPPVVAPFFGCFLGRTGTAGELYRVSPFTAARPISDIALVGPKFKVAALATPAAWAAALLAAAAWFWHSGSDARLWQMWDALRQTYPTWRVAAMLLLAVIGTLLLTWRLLADNLWVCLTGRTWLVRGSFLACGLAVTAVGIVCGGLADNMGLRARLWEDLPWWAAGAALLKVAAGAWASHALLRRGLVEPRALAKLLTVWLLAAGGLFALACAAVPADVVPVSLLASGAVLGMPLVRLAAAPLALNWNRHG